MNQKQKASLPSAKLSPASVNRSVTQVEPPPFLEYFEQLKAPPRRADEFTMSEFRAATGLSDRAARDTIAKDIASGKLSKRRSRGGEGGPILYSLNK